MVGPGGPPEILGVVTRKASRTTDWLAPVLADLVCVGVFALAGRSSHESGSSGWVVVAIMWPFALSVVAAHAIVLRSGRPARRVWPEGVAVLAVTYVLGMVLRVASGRGIAAGFLVVALVFLALTMLGWRTVRWLVTRRRTSRAR